MSTSTLTLPARPNRAHVAKIVAAYLAAEGPRGLTHARDAEDVAEEIVTACRKAAKIAGPMPCGAPLTVASAVPAVCNSYNRHGRPPLTVQVAAERDAATGKWRVTTFRTYAERRAWGNSRTGATATAGRERFALT